MTSPSLKLNNFIAMNRNELKVEINLNDTAPVHILGKRGPIWKSLVHMCLKKCFRQLFCYFVMRYQTEYRMIKSSNWVLIKK